MCGILGFYSTDSLKDEQLLINMGAAIRRRGPDEYGVYSNGPLKLGHNRLAIHDLSSAGAQPMRSHCGKYIIVFNGEIYNFKELRKKLESINEKYWIGHSDTEVLLEFIIHFGVNQGLLYLDGMFSFALYNITENSITFARDRFGEKPLYLYTSYHEFAFSSELKPIEIFTKNLTINEQAVSSQLLYSYIPNEHSIYKEVTKLLPGHHLTVKICDAGGFQVGSQVQYWSAVETALQLRSSSNNISAHDAQLNIEYALEQSVIERMASDVPLGAFLSGGIDSTCVVALMQKNSSKKINTFSIGFNDESYNEAHHAKAVAKALGTEHHEVYLDARDVIDLVPNLHSIYDEPFSDSSQLPTFMVSKFARSKVTVALTGDSGDEIFGGYNRHILAEKLTNIIDYTPYTLRKVISKLLDMPSPEHYDICSRLLKTISAGHLRINSLGDKAYKFSRVFDSKNGIELYSKLVHTGKQNICLKTPANVIDNNIFKSEGLSLTEQIMLQDIIGYMRNDILTKVDRASMACSLETRVPFLSNKVFEAAWRAPISLKVKNGLGKLPLRNIISKYVPDEIMKRPKAGFGVPIYDWLRNDLRDWAEYLLSVDSLEKSGLLNTSVIRQSWSMHLSGKHNLQYELWNVLMFQQWYLSK